MSVQVAGRQVLRWTLRSTCCSALNPVVFGRHHVRQSLPTSCRLLSSTHNQSSAYQQHSAEPAQPSLRSSKELSLRSLLDMGFTDTEAQEVYEATPRGRGGQGVEHVLSTLTALFVLGLNPSTILKVLEKCPELYHVKGAELQQRMNNLRKLGLLEGSLQRVVSHYPQILTLHVKRVRAVVRFLREKCLFTVQHVTDILRDSPAVVHEDLGQLEYKFQYAFFRMGVKQAEMIKSKLFRFTLEEMRCRHCFLERRGMYQTPDKKGQTLILNPKLIDILSDTEEAYLADIAKATQEEFDVFQKMMAREWQEEDEEKRDIEAWSDDEEDDDDDDDEEEGGKSAYMKKRKR